MKKIILASSLSIFSLSIFLAAIAYSYTITHPDLKNAHDLAQQAIQQVQSAQHTEATGGVDFGGHANKAIDLLEQARKELVAADQYNDAHQKKPKK